MSPSFPVWSSVTTVMGKVGIGCEAARGGAVAADELAVP